MISICCTIVIRTTSSSLIIILSFMSNQNPLNVWCHAVYLLHKYIKSQLNNNNNVQCFVAAGGCEPVAPKSLVRLTNGFIIIC